MSGKAKQYPRPGTVDLVRGYKSRHSAILFACCDPGAFTQRGDNYEESLENWQARAVAVAIEIFESATKAIPGAVSAPNPPASADRDREALIEQMAKAIDPTAWKAEAFGTEALQRDHQAQARKKAQAALAAIERADQEEGQ